MGVSPQTLIAVKVIIRLLSSAYWCDCGICTATSACLGSVLYDISSTFTTVADLLSGTKLYTLWFKIKLLNVKKRECCWCQSECPSKGCLKQTGGGLYLSGNKLQDGATADSPGSHLTFKLLHKLRLNITVEFRGAVKWDESVVTVGGLQHVSHHHHPLN